MNRFDRIERMISELRENFESDAYRDALNHACDKFGIELDDKDEIFEEWQEHKNMSADELRRWSKNPCSREASLNPVRVMKRNLRLLEKDKSEWTEEDYRDAERATSFISRMRGMKPDMPREGPHGCPSEWAISLLNWGFNPFDSVPTPSSEVKEDLDPVDEVSVEAEMAERRNIMEAESLAHHAWTMTDLMQEFADEFRGYATTLESESELENVRNIREQMLNSFDLLESKMEPTVREVEENPVDELDEHGYEYEFSPMPQQVLFENREDALERANTLGLEGVHKHPVIFRAPEDIPDDLMDDVTVYNMAGANHSNWAQMVNGDYDYEFSPIPQQVLYEEAEDAEARAADLDLDGIHLHPMIFRPVEEIPDEMMDDVTVYFMPGSEHSDWSERVVSGDVELRQASEVFHGDQERNSKGSEDDSVRVPPVAIHKVENGENVEVSDDVEKVLDDLWD